MRVTRISVLPQRKNVLQGKNVMENVVVGNVLQGGNVMTEKVAIKSVVVILPMVIMINMGFAPTMDLIMLHLPQ